MAIFKIPLLVMIVIKIKDYGDTLLEIIIIINNCNKMTAIMKIIATAFSKPALYIQIKTKLSSVSHLSESLFIHHPNLSFGSADSYHKL